VVDNRLVILFGEWAKPHSCGVYKGCDELLHHLNIRFRLSLTATVNDWQSSPKYETYIESK